MRELPASMMSSTNHELACLEYSAPFADGFYAHEWRMLCDGTEGMQRTVSVPVCQHGHIVCCHLVRRVARLMRTGVLADRHIVADHKRVVL